MATTKKKNATLSSEKTMTVSGKDWDDQQGQGSSTKKDISVFEVPEGIDMGEKKKNNQDLYGVPISLKNAVHMIADMLDIMEEAGLDLDDLPSILPPKEAPADNPTLKLLGQLLVTSLGITFDRSVILKILSQPTCEGLRFYVCNKKVGKPKKDYLSLIIVGVDIHGNDLLYSDALETLDAAKLSGDSDLSMLGEYGHPPLTGESFRTDRFALLKLAKDLHGTSKKVGLKSKRGLTGKSKSKKTT